MIFHYGVFNDSSSIKLIALQYGIENDCFLFSNSADMFGRNQNRSQEIKPYRFFFCQISSVYNLFLSSSLIPFHLVVCQLSGYLLTIRAVCYIFVLGSMLLTLHSVHCIYGFSPIWHPNSFDKSRVLLSPNKVGVKFSNDCCISRFFMFAEFSPPSLLYQFLERGDELAESPLSYKLLSSIVLLPDGEGFF